MNYNPALDGLRAFAVFVVLLFHARAPVGMGGYVGVDIFFVLSGFLITTLLLGELASHGRLDILGFWRRRLLRLTPALLAMLAVYALLAPLAWPEADYHASHALLAALYLSDYGVAWWGKPTLLSHTWSLAVEMHFYLLWPLVLLWAYRRWPGRSLVTALALGYVLATLLRWFWTIKGQSWEQVYYRMDTRLSGLMLGAWLAAALRDAWWRVALQRAVPWLLWLAIAALVCLQYRWHDLWMLMWGLCIAELGTAAVLITVQRPANPVSQMLARPALTWLGKMSYGVYLWHYPLFVWLRERYTWDVVLLVGVPASLALAAASYYTLEAWAARWRGPQLAAQAR